jgi:hypothetical protein
MTVQDLLAALNDLPVSALDKTIFIDNGNEQIQNITIEAVVESEEVIGYVLTESGQLELDFGGVK